MKKMSGCNDRKPHSGGRWGRGRGATKEVTCKVQPEEQELSQAKGWGEVGHTVKVMGGTASRKPLKVEEAGRCETGPRGQRWGAGAVC